jgi:protein involved in polysaccharide export with SLBB domain
MFYRPIAKRTGYAGMKRINVSNTPVSLGRRIALGVVVVLPLVGLTACDPTRSFERASDGSTVFLDERSDAAKSDARRKVVASLTRGNDVYVLEVGDEIEIFFNINRKPTAREYIIRVGDKLRIEFLSETENARTVEVRPDGRVSLPLIGPVVAAGQSPDSLARQLQQRYSGVLTGAQITVNVTEPHSPLQDFLDVIGTPQKGRSIVDKVLPDGTISVPMLRPLKARGRTLGELQAEIDAAYAAAGINVLVSLVPRSLRAGSTFVLGEVAKPGRIELERPRTVLMAVAQAGGILTSGSMSSVRLFYVAGDGEPRVRSINLRGVLDDLRIDEDMIVPDNSIIYVPTSELAKIGRVMDAVLRDILRYNGFNISAAYLLNQENGTTVVPTVR